MTATTAPSHGIVVVGASAGGLPVLTELARALGPCPWPVALVQHLAPGGDVFLAEHLRRHANVAAVVAQSFQPLQAGCWHVAPSSYHLLVEDRHTLALALDAPVHYCRPAIDPLFLSAVRVFGAATVAVVLTGANADGAAGCARIAAEGGTVLVQDPAQAEVSAMPAAALAACPKAEVFVNMLELSQAIRRRMTCSTPTSGT
jgi:two-component system chemotaxis response regulator CheB